MTPSLYLALVEAARDTEANALTLCLYVLVRSLAVPEESGVIATRETQTQLGKRLALTRKSICEQLAKLRRLGWVKTKVVTVEGGTQPLVIVGDRDGYFADALLPKSGAA